MEGIYKLSWMRCGFFFFPQIHDYVIWVQHNGTFIKSYSWEEVPENESYLKLRVFDEQGEIIAETGLIKPGEYLQTIQFSRAVQDDEPLSIKVMGYEPETYLSSGAVSLKPAVKNK